MTKNMTHKGKYTMLVDFGKSSTFDTELRELKKHWVTKKGVKHRKDDGYEVGERWNPKKLILSSIEELQNDEKII